MIEVKLNKSNENPFYGLKNCMSLMQSATSNITPGMLNAAYSEVKDDKVKREMFYSLLFSIGDITARQHNIFKGIKKDSGGNSNRQGFITIFDWLLQTNPDQFNKFLNADLFTEYTCFDLLFRSRVKTVKNKVVSVTNLFSNGRYSEVLLNYIYKVINGSNPYNKLLVAKFLTLPRLTKRSGHKKMLEETRNIMLSKAKFLAKLSELMGWEYDLTDTYANFKGYREWRKQYNNTLESVLFSTGKINEFDRNEFINWIDALPSQARFRVKNRILYSKNEDGTNKWNKFINWYHDWEQYKLDKQAESRQLEEKVRQGQATEEDKVKLEKVKKQAKVNIGATNFNEIYADICNYRVDKLKVESFINKVNLPYNSLVIIDDSGSMTGAPFEFAKFIASVCLVKNPDDDGRNLLGFFNTCSHWYSYIDREGSTPNSLLRTQVAMTKKTPFVDPNLSFLENYERISKFCQSVFQGGGTRISEIPEGLNGVCKRHPEVLDALRNYPVWTIISDGMWNNLPSPEASINDFFRRCENYFGFRPFIVAMDITQSGYSKYLDANRFSGVDNMIYIPSNPAQIEQFLTNFKDMDVFDIYTPLLSIYRSNRYDLVRENTI